MKARNMQHESSITHTNNLHRGLTVAWVRTSGEGDNSFDIVAYNDGSRWVFDNASGEQVTLLGEISDGLAKAEILKGSTGSIIAIYVSKIQAFADADHWVESLAEIDKSEAEAILAR